MRVMRGWMMVLLGAACLWAAPAAAAGRWTLGAQAGMAVPSGDFGDAMQSGFDGGVFTDYWVNEQFGIGIEIAGNFHTAKDEYNDAINAITEALLIFGGATTANSDLEVKASVLRFGLRGTLAVPTSGPVSPFVQAGAGFYRLNISLEGPVTADGVTIDIDESEDDTNFGLNGGVGVLFATSPSLSVGVQGQIHHVFTEDDATQYFSIGAVARFATGGN